MEHTTKTPEQIAAEDAALAATLPPTPDPLTPAHRAAYALAEVADLYRNVPGPDLAEALATILTPEEQERIHHLAEGLRGN